MNTSLALQDPCTAVALPLSFSVPLGDLTEFSALPETRRTEVQVTFKLLERVHALRGSGSLETACATVAATSQHIGRGWSKQSLRRKYEAFLGSCTDARPSGDWRVLVAQYRGPSEQPAEFTQELKRLAELNHRSISEAFEQLRERWRAGDSIPGYGTWFEHYMRLYPERPLPKTCPRLFFPTGWSCRNLLRYAPSKGARMLAQRGFAAAKRFFPSIVRDTSGLKPLEKVVIDDFVLDCLCVFPGDGNNPPQIAPVAGLLAKDVATRRNLVWGLGAQIERDEKQPDGSVRKVRCGIRRVDVQVLLHDLFAKYGLPDYTVTILCENATASIAPELELALSTLFEGRVRVERTGLIEHKTLTNGFVERGGKPWEKGWIESCFNSLWNKLGAMPGYKGSNQRLNSPADLDAKISCTKLLIGQGERQLNLPPEKIILLRLPFPSPEAVEQAFAWACAVSDSRTNHRYLGLDRVTEFLLEAGGEPQPFSALALLPPAQQQLAQPVDRAEAPIERWARLAQDVPFRPIPPSVLALLLLTPKRVAYRNHSVTFVHDRVGYTYVDAAGTVLRNAPDGAEFLGYFDATAPEQLHLADLRGAYAGTITRLGGKRGRVDIRDKAALAEAGAMQATIVNRTLAEVRTRHAGENAQLAQDSAHNAAIVAEHKAATAGFTTAQKIGLAAGENAQRAHEQRQRDAQAARPVSAQSAGKGLAELVQSSGTPVAAPVQGDDATPEAEEGASLSDIT